MCNFSSALSVPIPTYPLVPILMRLDADPSPIQSLKSSALITRGREAELAPFLVSIAEPPVKLPWKSEAGLIFK